MAHSQPGTPCPENNNGNVTNLTSEPALYQQPPPFATRNVCRGTSNLLANETAPYFSSSKPFDNLYACHLLCWKHSRRKSQSKY